MLSSPLPDLMTAAMGSGLQVAMPLLFAAVFGFRERDTLGTSLTLGWAATSIQDASVYIADAPYERLPLIGPARATRSSGAPGDSPSRGPRPAPAGARGAASTASRGLPDGSLRNSSPDLTG